MIVSRAPLRLGLGGGATDLPSYYTRFGGSFVSAAINKYVYVSVNRPASDDLIRVKYTRYEEVRDPTKLMHDLVREALIALDLNSNLEIVSMADVPAGTGMGSSGSYLVALLTALHALKREHQSTSALAEEACRIEIEKAGHPVGKQDQYAAAWGGLNRYEIDTAGKVTVTPLRIPVYAQEDLARYLTLYYTGKRRPSDIILVQQADAVRDGDQTMIDNLHRTRQLGLEAAAALEAADLVCFGQLLHEQWQCKKLRANEATDRQVDRWYSLARETGALGGKLTGAGGGGFLMMLSPDDAVKRKMGEMLAAEGLKEMPLAFEPEGSKVLMNV